MIQRTKFLFMLTLLPVAAFGKTVYSGEFDYHYFESPQVYFKGRTAAELARLCDGRDNATNDDLAQCSHQKFVRLNSELNGRLKAMREKLANRDKSLTADGEPKAMPYFEKAQSSWAGYRDNECYSETYVMGEAAERDIFFWECMAGITVEEVMEKIQIK